jgi:hypothetical protein
MRLINGWLVAAKCDGEFASGARTERHRKLRHV